MDGKNRATLMSITTLRHRAFINVVLRAGHVFLGTHCFIGVIKFGQRMAGSMIRSAFDAARIAPGDCPVMRLKARLKAACEP